MHKILLGIILLISLTHAQDKQRVYIASKNIKYNTSVYAKDLIPAFKKVNKKYCEDIDVIALNTNKYRAKSYLSKGRIVCLKDLKLIEIKQVNFSFGGIIIEKKVEKIEQTKKYIKIKNLDGKEEKIYKDGRNR